MTPANLKELLARVAAGEVSVEAALDDLRRLPFEDLGFARVDHHRELRQGAPEVIFGGGKTPEQIAAIAAALLDRGANVLATRVTLEAFEALRGIADDAVHHEVAAAATVICSAVVVICVAPTQLLFEFCARLSACVG